LHQAVIDAAGPAIADRLKLKWPNDLLLDRFKVAASPSKATSSVGPLRRGHRYRRELHEPPRRRHGLSASDFAARGVPITVEPLFDAWHVDGRGNCALGSRRQFPGDPPGLAGTLRGARRADPGEFAERVIEGRFDSLDDDGRLILTRLDGARETVSAGDVFFGTRLAG